MEKIMHVICTTILDIVKKRRVVATIRYDKSFGACTYSQERWNCTTIRKTFDNIMENALIIIISDFTSYKEQNIM